MSGMPHIHAEKSATPCKNPSKLFSPYNISRYEIFPPPHKVQTKIRKLSYKFRKTRQYSPLTEMHPAPIRLPKTKKTSCSIAEPEAFGKSLYESFQKLSSTYSASCSFVIKPVARPTVPLCHSQIVLCTSTALENLPCSHSVKASS